LSVFYLDSSAWLKRYFYEPGSGWIARLFEREERLASSVLGYIEVASALARQQESRKLDEQRLAKLREDLTEDWSNLAGLPLTDELVAHAVILTREYKLRGADAVHLATALGLKDSMTGLDESVVVVASDRELLEAARQAGLSVDDPIFKI
jgi:hypothetical protein